MPRTEYAAAGVEHRAGNCDLDQRRTVVWRVAGNSRLDALAEILTKTALYYLHERA